MLWSCSDSGHKCIFENPVINALHWALLSRQAIKLTSSPIKLAGACLAADVCISYNYKMERIWSNGNETYRHFLLYVLAALLFIVFLTTHRHGRLMWHRHLTILSRIFRLKNNISSYQFYFCHLTHDNGPFKLLWHSLLLFFGTSALFRLCY